MESSQTIQSFTNTAINQFLCKFDHVKVNPSKATKSVCKFRTYAKTADRAINDLKRCGVRNFNIKLVDFCKIVEGETSQCIILKEVGFAKFLKLTFLKKIQTIVMVKKYFCFNFFSFYFLIAQDKKNANIYIDHYIYFKWVVI